MLSFQEMLDQAGIGFSQIQNRADYIEHCKTAVATARGWAAKNWLFIRYVMHVWALHFADGKLRKHASAIMLNSREITGQKIPIAVGIAFCSPDGKLLAGGAACDPRDRWNRHIGQWLAIKHAKVIPETTIIGLQVQATGPTQALLDPNNKNLRIMDQLLHPWDIFKLYPHKARKAVLSCAQTAVYCHKKHGLVVAGAENFEFGCGRQLDEKDSDEETAEGNSAGSSNDQSEIPT